MTVLIVSTYGKQKDRLTDLNFNDLQVRINENIFWAREDRFSYLNTFNQYYSRNWYKEDLYRLIFNMLRQPEKRISLQKLLSIRYFKYFGFIIL